MASSNAGGQEEWAIVGMKGWALSGTGRGSFGAAKCLPRWAHRPARSPPSPQKTWPTAKSERAPASMQSAPNLPAPRGPQEPVMSARREAGVEGELERVGRVPLRPPGLPRTAVRWREQERAGGIREGPGEDRKARVRVKVRARARAKAICDCRATSEKEH